MHVCIDRYKLIAAAALITENEIAPNIEFRSAREPDAELIRDAVTAVAHEKWYLATVEGWSLDDTRAFLKHISEGDLPQLTAFADNVVVGFCDIVPNAAVGFKHVGRLGMGVRSEWRRQGIGRRLLETCLAHGKRSGLEKVELEVYSDNVGAVGLYEAFGFKREGVRVRGRKFANRYQDIILMALWL